MILKTILRLENDFGAVKLILELENGFEASKMVLSGDFRCKWKNPEYRIFQNAKWRHYAK